MPKDISIVGSNTRIYLLVMTVWDRQEGANTALKSHKEQQPFSVFFNPPLFSSWGCAGLRVVPQRILDLFAKVLNVLPLLLRKALPAHVDVLHFQLLLIKQPLHNKHRHYTGKKITRTIQYFNTGTMIRLHINTLNRDLQKCTDLHLSFSSSGE